MKKLVLLALLWCFALPLQAQRVGILLPQAKSAVVAVSPNEVYIGYRTLGLYLFDGFKADTVSFYLPSKQIRSLAYRQGVLWVGTANGLYRVIGNQITHFSQASGQLPADTVLSLCFWQNQLVIGTNGGLVLHQGTQWSTFTNTNSNLPVNRVVSVRSAFNRLAIVAGNQAGFWQQQFVPIPQTLVSNVRIAIPTESGGAILASDQQACWWLPMVNPKILPEFAGATDLQPRANGLLMGVNLNKLMTFEKGDAWDINLARITNNSGFLSEDSTGILHVATQDRLLSDSSFEYVDRGFNSRNVKQLHINQIDAITGNKGNLFLLLNEPTFASFYNLPAHQGNGNGFKPNTLFAASPWIGGYSNGQLHQSAQTYGQTSVGGRPYYPGPLFTSAVLDTTLSGKYDRIWKISRLDIENFKWAWQQGLVQQGNFLPVRDIREWPGNHPQNGSMLAPFFDRNADGQYNYLDGDYPLIKGDQALWMVLNDKHPNRMNDAPALGIEMQVLFYAYQCNQLNNADTVLNYTTFVEYKIKNKAERNYEQVFFTYWTDVDLGNGNDDLVGTDVNNHGIYFYNGLSMDAGVQGFGLNPPAQGIYWMRGALARAGDGIDNDRDGLVDEPGEQVLMSHSMFTRNDNSVLGHPTNANHFALQSRGRFKDSTQMVYGGTGYPTSIGSTSLPARFVFPMNSDSVGWGLGGNLQLPILPPFAWSETNPGPGAAANVPADRKMQMSAGPFDLASGQEQVLEFAFIYSRANSGGPMASLQKLLQTDAPRIRQWYSQAQFPSCLDLSTVSVNDAKQQLQLRSYPNPAYNTLFVETTSELPMTLRMTDLQGRLVHEQQFAGQTAYQVDLPATAPGMYLLQWEQGGLLKFEKLIKR